MIETSKNDSFCLSLHVPGNWNFLFIQSQKYIKRAINSRQHLLLFLWIGLVLWCLKNVNCIPIQRTFHPFDKSNLIRFSIDLLVALVVSVSVAISISPSFIAIIIINYVSNWNCFLVECEVFCVHVLLHFIYICRDFPFKKNTEKSVSLWRHCTQSVRH